MKTKLTFYTTRDATKPHKNITYVYILEYLREDHVFLHPRYYCACFGNKSLPYYMVKREFYLDNV